MKAPYLIDNFIDLFIAASFIMIIVFAAVLVSVYARATILDNIATASDKKKKEENIRNFTIGLAILIAMFIILCIIKYRDNIKEYWNKMRKRN
jgi:hypothetical protein